MHHQGAVLGRTWSTASRRAKTSSASIRGVPSSQHVNNRAQWNVQVVRGKVTSRCLWNACKALTLGLLLMFIGGAMATIGYFADQLSVNQEVRGNATIHVKNESRGFHLNNLSYAGPIVMGVGGFIVVAACVMTFEARDSAAKVVPARFKPKSSPPRNRGDDGSGRRSAGCQTRWDNLGVFRAVAQGATTLGLATPLASALPSPAVSVNRREMKTAFVHFSRNIQSSVDSAGTRRGSLAKCPSAPNLAPATIESSANTSGGLLSQFIRSPPPQSAHNAITSGNRKIMPRRQSSSLRQACPLLSPHPLQQRQALSVDYTNFPLHYSPLLLATAQSVTPPKLPQQPVERAGSEMSMVLDLHLPDDCQVTLRVRDQNKPPPLSSQAAPRLHQRSETARRHQLTRQKPVDETGLMTPTLPILDVSNEIAGSNGRGKRNPHTSRRESYSNGKPRHHHRVRRSNTTCDPSYKPPLLGQQVAMMRRSFEDQTTLSLTPSPERDTSTTLQVHSNPPSSNHSFELTSCSPLHVEPQPSCSHHPDPFGFHL